MGESDETTKIPELRDRLGQIAGYDVSRDLVRAAELGSASFFNYQKLLEEVQAYASILFPLPWELVPESIVETIRSSVDNVVRTFDQIKEFNLQRPDPMAGRDALAKQLKSNFDGLRVAAIPVVGYLSWQSVNLDEMREMVAATLAQAKEQFATATKEIEEKQLEADKALDAIRAVSAQAGVSHHAQVFAAAADRYAESARNWGIASIVVGVGMVAAALGIVLLWDVNGDISDASVVQLVAVKGIVLVAAVYALLTCIRLFRSNSHLAIVNRQREDALKTFRAFAEATGDEIVRDKVLLEVTHAIFSPAATGLIDGREISDSVSLLDAATGLIVRKS
jgi:nucleotide-binding universal stress UspA family protein